MPIKRTCILFLEGSHSTPAIEILLRDKRMCQTRWQTFELVSGFDMLGQGIPSKIMISIHQYAADLFVAPHILLDMHDPTGENMCLNMTLTSSFHDPLEIHIVQRTLRLDLDVPHEVEFHGVNCHEWNYCQCIKTEYSLLETIWEVHEGIGGKLLFIIGINHYGRERVLTSLKKTINIPQSKNVINKTGKRKKVKSIEKKQVHTHTKLQTRAEATKS